MNRRLILVLIMIVLFLFGCSRSPETAIERRIRRVENGLLADMADPPWRRMTLAERMAHYDVPGVSIAVINDHQIEWAKGYGLLQAGSPDPVTAETFFQTGSIAKPVIAAAALHHVEQGLLDLDQDVNQSLVSWQLPQNQFTAEEKVTLRRLLSHTAGVTVHGFVGYAQGEEIPTLQQILDGEPPANSPPIRVDTIPGSQFRYSGGGYMIVQQLLEDVTGAPFPDMMKDTILEPWGMSAATLQSPLPEDRWANAASGHYANGSPMPGRWHNYPEHGAGASMWATPSDMATFALGVMQSYAGQSDKVLSQEMAVQMLSPQITGRGLGPSLGHDGADRFYFMHDGINDGYKSVFAAYPQRGQGVVIMTNADSGDALWREILNSVSVEYGYVPNNSAHYAAVALALALAVLGVLLLRQKKQEDG